MIKLGPENTTWDDKAKYLYNLHRNWWGKPQHLWKPYEGISRKERDHWRMLVLTSEGIFSDDILDRTV